MAKDFRVKAAKTPSVYGSIIGSAQDAQHTQEVPKPQPEQAIGSTQGRKGAKLPRINMAFSTESLDYLRVMSALKGMSITKYVNDLVEQDRTRNAAAYNAAKNLTQSF